MQIIYPWGKENIGFDLNMQVIKELNQFSEQCQTYYNRIEKIRNGSISDPQPFDSERENLMRRLDEFVDGIRMEDPSRGAILALPMMRESFIASLIAYLFEFDYRLNSVMNDAGRIEFRGILKDRSGFQIETNSVAEINETDHPMLLLGSVQWAAKKAFVQAVSQMSELDFASRAQEVLI